MSNVTVRGTDGFIPQYDPNGLFHIWGWNEVYFGEEGKNKYVGKVGDLIRRVTANGENKEWLITDLDLNTLIPTIVAVGGDEDVLGGQILIGDGLQPVTFRLFYDTSTLPFTASIDSRHFVNGSDNTYARIFRGVDTSPTGKVISAVFNGSNYVDDKIPLELIVYDDHTNLARKAVPSFNTKEIMPDGEVCTVVIYNAQNKVTDKKPLIVEKTSWIRPVNDAQKYIAGITLKSLFLNSNNPYVLDFPLNVPVDSLNAFGLLHYSDGSRSEPIPVDGNKFTLHGLEAFVATRPGQKIPLVLSYRLDDNEPTYGAVSADGKKITENYEIVTTFENGTFSPVLFGYPYWDKTENKYKMRWWLMDLNRVTLFDATNQVQYNQSSDVFDGLSYNTIQMLSVRIDLSSISQSLPNWIHTQTLFVKLFNPNVTNKIIPSFEVGQENIIGTFYGTDLQARVTTIDQNNFQINIQNNITTLNEWIDKLFYSAKPIFSLYKESKAPIPTHFTVINDINNVQTFPINSWNQNFQIFTNISQQSNLRIRWDRRLNDSSVLQLAVTEIPMNFLN